MPSQWLRRLESTSLLSDHQDFPHYVAQCLIGSSLSSSCKLLRLLSLSLKSLLTPSARNRFPSLPLRCIGSQVASLCSFSPAEANPSAMPVFNLFPRNSRLLHLPRPACNL